MQKANPWFVLLGFVALCLAAGALGGWATSQAVVDWYPTLNKPSWNPPSWVFAPVWTTLYLMMAVSAWLVWRTQAPAVGPALKWFFIQLALNCLWSFLFFGIRSPGLAVVEIVFLWLALLMTIVSFWPLSRLAGILLLPYIAWVSFAAFLNYTVWSLN
jgi:tryptophan-rich sensory protein